MKKNKIINTSLLLICAFLLTSCPYSTSRYSRFKTTEQGSIYALSLKNDEFGISLKNATTEIQVLDETITTPSGSLLATNAKVSQTLEVYNNNLSTKKATFVLPIFKTIQLDNYEEDRITPTLSCYLDNEVIDIVPVIQNGMVRTLSSIDYDVVKYEEMEREMEFINEIPSTLYQYRVQSTSSYNDANRYGFECLKSTETMPFFLFEDSNVQLITNFNSEKEIYEGMLSFPIDEEITFYSNVDYSLLWNGKESFLEMNEVQYDDLVLKESETHHVHKDLLHSYLAMNLFQNQNAPFSFYFSSFNDLFDDVLFQNYFLVYPDVPLEGNNAITKLECTYFTRIEKEFKEQEEHYLMSYVYDNLSNFTRVDEHHCRMVFNRSYGDQYSIIHDSGAFSIIKDDAYSYNAEIENNVDYDSAYFGYRKNPKNNSSCLSSCNRGTWGIKYFFGIIFIVIYLSIELSYRRRRIG